MSTPYFVTPELGISTHPVVKWPLFPKWKHDLLTELDIWANKENNYFYLYLLLNLVTFYGTFKNNKRAHFSDMHMSPGKNG